MAAEKIQKYKTEIQQMMFVSGETGETSPETTCLIEHIVQQQVQEILRECTALATRRGNRSIATDDLMMLFRHDKAKLSRLRHFLQWKDVRKNVKDSSDDKGGGPGEASEITAADDSLGAAGMAAAAGAGGAVGSGADLKKTRKARVDLLWDVPSFFSETVPARDDEEDDGEEEMNSATLERLRMADERTKSMSREDYMHWSECRQASFTFRKAKRFREWAGFGLITDSKPNDDIIDILGFLTFEIVQKLTEEALKVKQAQDQFKKRCGGGGGGGPRSYSGGLSGGSARSGLGGAQSRAHTNTNTNTNTNAGIDEEDDMRSDRGGCRAGTPAEAGAHANERSTAAADNSGAQSSSSSSLSTGAEPHGNPTGSSISSGCGPASASESDPTSASVSLTSASASASLTLSASDTHDTTTTTTLLSSSSPSPSSSSPRKRKREPGLFDWPEEARESIDTSQVIEVFRRLQSTGNRSKAILNFTTLMHRYPLKLI